MSGIELKNVTKRYKENKFEITALENVSVQVKAGEFVAIVGPSGSGKSTFLSIAGALLKPTEGSIMINNQNITDFDEKQLSSVRLNQIGFILQTANLIPYLTVLDQLLIVKKMQGTVTKEDKAFALELLKDLGLENKEKKYPNECSGGERQRVAIARSFMNDPDIILADEPTSSLDTDRGHEVVQQMAEQVKTRNKAAIMVTHDERMLSYCDRVYRIVDGKLSEEVRTQEV
ncbi:MAG: ABC transporter ATP-binding protein [Alkalibacterium sp.]|uniref:Putative ABC transport system ATP-binding protein n=1 Tax=Alkalibacterium gilvum TaxID=1130080 RepID=A0A1H6UL21_9LACT|nr:MULTISPECIES: ABC transporter ATP-binding protein [Alkalibacterium]MDN6195746.1 ABC transporter ATP-binding protein [Atopostipes suicloacalis]MDN6294603.1 ABC transporter ATP-binding protein [Alkalibacterium sp.]MDN6296138.1 ABC transporter ATP-binding protein [Alkalibacterium sp.]MDN6327223.1 ABC transporter ATP-binding protein [Alkalibacterium sp.]MDN6385789.1 ABC transporter ATP-binding protein [Alkalibacterium sp.]